MQSYQQNKNIHKESLGLSCVSWYKYPMSFRLQSIRERVLLLRIHLQPVNRILPLHTKQTAVMKNVDKSKLKLPTPPLPDMKDDIPT